MLRLLLLALYLQYSVAPTCCEKRKESCPRTKNVEVLDTDTPEGEYLSAYFGRSYAYGMVKNRMPSVIVRVIDVLRHKRFDFVTKFGEVVDTDIQDVISAMNKLKEDIECNRELKNLTSPLTDAKIYNDYIAEQAKDTMRPAEYFHTTWLLSETYFYRRIRESFELTNFLKNFDPFQNQKEEAFRMSLPIIRRISIPFLELTTNSEGADKENFIKLLKLNLWGNKCDLAHPGGCVTNRAGEDLMNVKSMDDLLVRDDSELIWDAISDEAASSNIVDFVIDNAAYEVFTDLCLADYIVSSKLAEKVRFHAKPIPWFISDTMRKDIYWIISQLMIDPGETLASLGRKWGKYIEDGAWKIEEKDFWILPFGYSKMKQVDPDLYKQLGESKLIIFKGDLNYRKLFNYRSWNPTTDVIDGLEGFNPAKLCSLRTLKADIVCGLTKEAVERANGSDADWMTSGKYGMIVFTDMIKPLE